MTDLDRYLTEEVVEKAARAIYESERMSTPWRDAPGEDQRWFAGQSRAALSAVLPDIIQQAKAEALREAARAYQWGGWARNPQARGDMRAKSSQAEHAVKWLRDQADEIAGDDS